MRWIKCVFSWIMSLDAGTFRLPYRHLIRVSIRRSLLRVYCSTTEPGLTLRSITPPATEWTTVVPVVCRTRLREWRGDDPGDDANSVLLGCEGARVSSSPLSQWITTSGRGRCRVLCAEEPPSVRCLISVSTFPNTLHLRRQRSPLVPSRETSYTGWGRRVNVWILVSLSFVWSVLWVCEYRDFQTMSVDWTILEPYLHSLVK